MHLWILSLFKSRMVAYCMRSLEFWIAQGYRLCWEENTMLKFFHLTLDQCVANEVARLIVIFIVQNTFCKACVVILVFSGSRWRQCGQRKVHIPTVFCKVRQSRSKSTLGHFSLNPFVHFRSYYALKFLSHPNYCNLGSL